MAGNWGSSARCRASRCLELPPSPTDRYVWYIYNRIPCQLHNDRGCLWMCTFPILPATHRRSKNRNRPTDRWMIMITAGESHRQRTQVSIMAANFKHSPAGEWAWQIAIRKRRHKFHCQLVGIDESVCCDSLICNWVTYKEINERRWWGQIYW